MKMISNKNFLLNWDFRNPVNQRGKDVYSIDRWRTHDGISAEVDDKCIRLTCTKEAGRSFKQIVEQDLSGKMITFSVLSQNITQGIILIIVDETTNKNIAYKNVYGEGIHFITAVIPDESRISVQVNPEALDSTVEVLCAKLELGSIPTLANDPPANYGEQLALCQRYCQDWEPGAHVRLVDYGIDYLDFFFPIALPLCTTPTLIGTLVVKPPSGSGGAGGGGAYQSSQTSNGAGGSGVAMIRPAKQRGKM